MSDVKAIELAANGLRSINLNQAGRRPLAERLIRELKSAIADGRLSVGASLPSRSEMACALGVSERIVRQAIAQLAAEGLVDVRPRRGCRVLSRYGCRVSGRVLFVIGEGFGSYPMMVEAERFIAVMSAAGYRTDIVAVGYVRKTPDYGPLKLALKSCPDLAVIAACRLAYRGVHTVISHCGVRTFRGISYPDSLRGMPAVAEFVSACRRNGITSVGQFGFGRDSIVDARPPLREAGIFVEEINICLDAVFSDLAAIQKAAQAAMVRRLGEGPLPELLFFTDDFLTMGALPVLMEKGVRIPEDVKVVTVANRGFGPVFLKTFARIDYDPRQIGEDCARRTLEFLETGSSSSDVCSLPRYLSGETFPDR